MHQSPKTMDPLTLLQRQMEVSGSLRDKVTSPEALEEVRRTMSDLVAFFSHINRLATKLQLPIVIVFQCLMQIGFGDTMSFDKQCRQGNVPMHQAKVLDRNASLQAQQTEPKVRAEVSADKLDELVNQCQQLRHLCRMKVEDGNDLSMARKMVSLSSEYLQYIYEVSKGNLSNMWRIYIAEDEKEVLAALNGLEGMSGGDGTEEEVSGSHEVSLPKDFVKAIAAECNACLLTTKAPFAQRSEALNTIHSWVQRCGEECFSKEGTFTALFLALQEGLKVHLGEKRSVLCRTACNILGVLCLRSRPGYLTSGKVAAIVGSWLSLLLSQVHVTVSAIADASDTVVRDVIVSTQGAPFVFNCIQTALQKATQVSLRRKCLGFLCLAVIASPHDVESAPLTATIKKYTGNSDDAARRLARYLGVLMEVHCPASPTGLDLWDAKVEKMAESERHLVIEAAHSIELFEMSVLGYELPCGASVLIEEKLACPRQQSALLSGTSSGSGSSPTYPSFGASGSTKIKASSTKSTVSSGGARSELTSPVTVPTLDPAPVKPWKRKATPTVGGTKGSSTAVSEVPFLAKKKPGLKRSKPAPTTTEPAVVNKRQLSENAPSLAPSALVEEEEVQQARENERPFGDLTAGNCLPSLPHPHQQIKRVSTPGVPLSLRSFSQDQLNDSAKAKPVLSASLRQRRMSRSDSEVLVAEE